MSGNTVNVGRFETALDAHFAQGLLEQRGIPCFVVGEATGTTWGFSMGPAEGIRLSVREEDLDAAKEVLEEVAHHGKDPATAVEEPFTEDVGAESGDPSERDVDGPLADRIPDGRAWARRVRALAVLLIPLEFLLSTVPGIPLLFPAVVFVLLLTPRARRESSSEGRRYLSQAWVALIIAVMVHVTALVVILFKA